MRDQCGQIIGGMTMNVSTRSIAIAAIAVTAVALVSIYAVSKRQGSDKLDRKSVV